MIGSHTKNDRLSGSLQGGRARRDGSPLELLTADFGKGRVMYVRDVLELICHGKSSWWVRNNFAPEYRFKVGRSPAWWEKDALSWLDKQGGASE